MQIELSKYKEKFALIEFICIWFVWMLIGFFLSYAPGIKGAGTAIQSFRKMKKINPISYDEILNKINGSIKIKANNNAKNISLKGELFTLNELYLYAFAMNKNAKTGFHSLLICFFIFILIFIGLNFNIIYIIVAALIIFGIYNIIKGIMDIF